MRAVMAGEPPSVLHVSAMTCGWHLFSRLDVTTWAFGRHPPPTPHPHPTTHRLTCPPAHTHPSHPVCTIDRQIVEWYSCTLRAWTDLVSLITAFPWLLQPATGRTAAVVVAHAPTRCGVVVMISRYRGLPYLALLAAAPAPHQRRARHPRPTLPPAHCIIPVYCDRRMDWDLPLNSCCWALACCCRGTAPHHLQPVPA